MDLKPKPQRFVEEYLVDLNATQAAIRAGYSAASARVQGRRMLTNAAIRNRIQELMDMRAERLEISGEQVLRELARIAFANMSDFLSVDAAGHLSICQRKRILDVHAHAKSVIATARDSGRTRWCRRIV